MSHILCKIENMEQQLHQNHRMQLIGGGGIRLLNHPTVGVIKKFPFRIVLRLYYATLSKTLQPYYGANRNYGSPTYSVITRFIRVNNTRA